MPYLSSFPDTLIVGTVDIQALPGIQVNDLDGLLEVGPLRGSNYVVPNRDGEVGVHLKRDAFDFSVGVTVLCNPALTDLVQRRGSMLAYLSYLDGVLGGVGGLMPLKRRLSLPDGTYYESGCNGQFKAGRSMTFLNPETGQTLLTFRNLDGKWS